MTTIYLVTWGCGAEHADNGDDFHVERIFSTREKAEDWIGPATATYDIREWSLDDAGTERPTRYWQAEICLDTGEPMSKWVNYRAPRVDLLQNGFVSESWVYPRHPRETCVIARSTVSHEHALELATAVRDRWLAANEAPTSA